MGNIFLYTKAEKKLTEDEQIRELSRVTGIDEKDIKETEFTQIGKALIIYGDGVGMEMMEEDLQEIKKLINSEVE